MASIQSKLEADVDVTQVQSRWVSCASVGTLLLILVALAPINAHGQASLAAENIIDDVTVGEEVFTLFRDAREPSQWYYVPNRPRLVTRTINRAPQPEFSLIRYQFQDPGNAQKLVEEGILQFATTLAAPPEALEAFRAAIRKRTQTNNVRISAIPFKSADVALYAYASGDKNGTLVSYAPYGSGIAPVFASQQMVFSVPLTRIGSDVVDALVTGETGMPVAVTFTFNALTPPAGFKVKMNWSQIFEHYSKDEKFRASASYFGWFGASYERSVQEIREQLINNKDIEVETITGEAFKQEDIDKYLQPILARINAELIESARPPAQVDPAAASAPSAGGWFGSAGYSVAIKDVKKVKSGSETWNMKVQHIVERKTVAQGFIGIGKYSKEVRDRLVTLVPPSKFESAYLMLPSPAVAAELGVTSLDLQVTLRRRDEDLRSQVVQWRPSGSGWKNVDNKDAGVLAFGLADLSGADRAQAQFVSKLRVNTARQTIDIISSTPALKGEQAMPGINGALFDVVEIDAADLPFAQVVPDGAYRQANVRVVPEGMPPIEQALRPRVVNNERLPPEPLRVLVPRSPDGQPRRVSATIKLLGTGGRRYAWRADGLDLRSRFDGLSVVLDEADFVLQP